MKLYDWQEQAVEQITALDGAVLLAAQMGMGKTLMALTWVRRAEAWPALVVCPASVKPGWERTAGLLGMEVVVLEGRTPADVGPADLLVINYDIIASWVPWLKQRGFRTLIMDESQRLAHRTTGWTKAVKNLSRSVPHRIALSGTPMMSRPAELWPTLNILRPDKYSAFLPFGRKYCGPRLTRWGWEFKGATCLDELRNELSEVMIRLRKADVMTLPQVHQVVRPLPIEREQIYQEASYHFLRWLSKQSKAKANRASKAEGIVRIAELRKLAARLKARALVEWLEEWFAEAEEDEKLVIYGVHRKMIEMLERRSPVKAVVLDGRTSGKERRRVVEQFRDDPRTRLFVGNVLAAGVGIDGLQSSCSTVAFAELPWRPSDVAQATDRLHRIGQERAVICHYLIGVGTIEEQMCNLLQRKQERVDQVLDGISQQQSEFDLFDKLVSQLKEKQNAGIRTVSRS